MAKTKKTKKETTNTTPDTAAELVKAQTPNKELALTVLSQLSPSDTIDVLVRVAGALESFHWAMAKDTAETDGAVDTKALAMWVADGTKLSTIVELAKTL